MKIHFVVALLVASYLPGRGQNSIGGQSTFSSAVVKIVFVNAPKDTVRISALAVTNVPSGVNNAKLMPIYKKGTYYLQLDIDRPLAATLNLNDELYRIVLTPTDTTVICLTTNNEELIPRFVGKNCQLNKYYQDKRNHFGYLDTRIAIHNKLTPSITYVSFAAAIDSILDEEIHFFKNYIPTEAFPEWFLDYELSEIRYLVAGYKTALPGINRLFNMVDDTLPDHYFDFLEKIEINNKDALFSSFYLSFLTEYFTHDIHWKEVDKLSGYKKIQMIHANILKRSGDKLSNDIKKVYYKHLLSKILSYLDTDKIDSVARAYSVIDYQDLLERRRLKEKNKGGSLTLNKGDTIPDFYVTDTRDSLVSIKEFGNRVIYLNFWATWCAPCIKNIPELNKLITKYSEDKRVVFINICMGCEKEKWSSSVERYGLKGVNLLSEGNWIAKLIKYFSIQGMPHYVLMDKGNILVENHTDKAPLVETKINDALNSQY